MVVLGVIGVVAIASPADYCFKLSIELFTFGQAVAAADQDNKDVSNGVSSTSTVFKNYPSSPYRTNHTSSCPRHSRP
jgi:hypothetical protein